MAVSGKQPLEVALFKSGITDDIFSGELDCGQEMDNFVIAPDGKLLTRSGSVLDDAINSPIPLGNSRVGLLVNYARNDKLFVQSGLDFFYRPNADQTGPYVDLLGPTRNKVLNTGDQTNFISTAEWNKQMFIVSDAFANPMKIYKDGSNTYQVRSVGLPALGYAPTITPAQTGSQSYVYGFIYSYQYQVGSQTFLEEGPVTFVTVSAGGSVNNVISNIANIDNAEGSNYDLNLVSVQVYRTTANGTNLYQVGSLQNGGTTFTDTIDDQTLQTYVQLYTNDGTLDYNPAPQAKFIHIVGNVGLYGYTNDLNGTHPYRIHQSVEGNPGFVPAITYVDLEDEVTGVGSVKALPIAFCKNIVYRLDGNFLSSGAGGITPTKIHNTAGCISHQSIIEAENYCFWAGQDGFYATDGYQVIKISDHLNTTYKKILSTIVDTRRIQGRFDKTNRRVVWSAQLQANSLEQDTLFCLDLRWGVSPKSTFTTWSGNAFKCASLEVFNGLLYRGDNHGFVFLHDNVSVTDPRVDVSNLPTAWSKQTIIWNYLSNQLNFGSAFFRKFVSRILVQAENAGNTSIQITAINDQGKKIRPLKPIIWRRNLTWGDSSVAWRNADCVWNSSGLIEQWRRFPAGGLRLSYLQIQMTNAFTLVTSSQTDGQLTLNRALKTVQLPNLWPGQSVDYVLTLSNDNYHNSYPVQSINSSNDTLTLIDAGNTLPPSGQYGWQLSGYEKGEPLNLIGYTLHWDQVDQNQNTYHQATMGA